MRFANGDFDEQHLDEAGGMSSQHDPKVELLRRIAAILEELDDDLAESTEDDGMATARPRA